MIGIFLQVRLNSTRLPRKALLELPGGKVIEHAMRALKLVTADVYALLTDTASAEALKPLARREGYELFIGPADDVLARYCRAARFFGTAEVVRATGDNPLVSASLARKIIRLHRKQKADLSHFLGMPLGTGIEVVQHEALLRAAAQAQDPYEREHLTTYLYRHPEDFKVLEPRCPKACYFPDVKVSLDTHEDYQLMQRLFTDLYRGRPVPITQIVNWLKERRSERGCVRTEENSFCS